MSLPDHAPPPLDPIAARRWQNLMGAPLTSPTSPWLHEEVGRRMAERLNWIKQRPDAWLDWAPARGGLAAHRLVAGAYPAARQWVHEPSPRALAQSQRALVPPWWHAQRWWGGQTGPEFGLPPAHAMGMVWSNMGLHSTAQPVQWMSDWHQSLRNDGFLMFSCLGPDTLKELRALYEQLGWPAPAQAFTDMHDWGDLLVEAGFSEPVMDMERIVLTYATPERLLEELRELGRNLHPQRFGACRGRGWWGSLKRALETMSPMQLTFEVIYGHAIKPPTRLKVAPEAVISLDDMKASLRRQGPTKSEQDRG